ncbi:MAG: J domain-containing protein [Polyangiaceae bacterium]|nr:J domain-containing protein [Polyangiaceae bacterium]
MSENAPSNHYATLGVERTADARAIKKAYFALIRQYSPETHPDEFKKIRAAYEVLSDPAARDRYDEEAKGFGEYENEVAQALTTADELALAGQEEAAQSLLVDTINRHPDVVLLREKLAASYSRCKLHNQAIFVLDGLLQKAPDNARYHGLRGLASIALGQWPEAERSLWRARELAPEDEGIESALLNVLSRQRKLQVALKILDETAARLPLSSRGGLGVALRRIQILFECDEDVAGEDAIAELVEATQQHNDPDLSRQVAAELGGPAAVLFNAMKPNAANRIMEYCRKLWPDSRVYRNYPAKAERVTLDLPMDAQRWLARRECDPESPTLRYPLWSRPLWIPVAIVGALLSAVALLYSVPWIPGRVGPWRPFAFSIGGAVVIMGISVTICALAAHFIRAMILAKRTLVQNLMTVHPLYVIRASPLKTEFYPILRLQRTDGVHHSQNGTYTHTVINLYFETERLSLSVNNPNLAQGLLDHVVTMKVRALELLAGGYLEAEHEVDPVPPSLLEPPSPVRSTAQERRRRWGTVAAVAVALWGGAMLLSYHYSDELEFRQAFHQNTPASYAAYLQNRPNGRFAVDAKRELDRQVANNQKRFEIAVDHRAKGAQATLAFGNELLQSTPTKIPVSIVFKSEVTTLSETLYSDIAESFPSSLEKTLRQVNLPNTSVVGTSGARETGPRSSPQVELDCTVSKVETADVTNLKAVWTVRLWGGKGEIYTFTTTTIAPLPDKGGVLPDEYKSLLATQYREFAHLFYTEMGLAPAVEVWLSQVQRSAGLVSPYDK